MYALNNVFTVRLFTITVLQRVVLEFVPLCNEWQIKMGLLSMYSKARAWARADLPVALCLLDECNDHNIRWPILELAFEI